MGHKILHFPHTFTVIFANFFSKQDGAKSSEKVHSHADFLSILFLVFRHSIVHSAAVLLSSVWLWLRSQELQRRHQETWVFVTLIFFSLLTAYAQKQLQEPIVIILDIAKTESNNCLYTVGGYLWHFIYQQFGGRPQNCYTDRIFFFYFSVPIELRRTPPFYSAVHSTVSKVLNSNGYSEVNLSKLFSAFFV